MNPPELELETPDCPMCSTDSFRVRFSGPGFEPYRVVRCTACGFHYLSPRPTEAAIRSLYEDDDYWVSHETGGYSDYRLQERPLRLTYCKLLRGLARLGMTGGAMLEVGCAHGFLLDEARPFFERREGTELSGAAATAAAELADRVYEGGLDRVPRERRFDLVISTQVIEHLHHPLEFIEQQAARLKRGGRVVVATPFMGGPLQRVMGRRWPSFKIPEHISYFDPRSLRGLMERAGLEEIRRLPYAHAFPLALIASKLGLEIGGRLGALSLWVPWTTFALAGTVRGTKTLNVQR
jgi:SAM-dependent methyltransferase